MNELKWYGLSLVLHVVFIFVVTNLVPLPPKWVLKRGVFEWVSVPKQKGELEGTGQTNQAMAPVEFQGISYAEYLRRKKAKQRKATNDRASLLLRRMQQLSFGDDLSGGNPTPLDFSGEGFFKLGSSKTSNRLTQKVGAQRFTYHPVLSETLGDGLRRMTLREKALLRAKFRELGKDFRKIYSRALTQDPHLQLTISFEAEIGTAGFLEVKRFHSRGSYRQESIRLMKAQMAELINKVFVAEDLSGTLIRGESVFLR